MSLITELKRRNVFKVGAAYLALGWVITQVTATVAPFLRLPDWTVPMVVWVGVIGFPCVLLFSWVYELTPEGLKRESEIDRSTSITHLTSRRLDYLIIALLVLAIGLFAFGQFQRPPTGATEAGLARENPVGAGLARDAIGEQTATGLPDDKSIAVLPFVNMSSDKEQDYFSDGLSEELLNLLARVPQLEVIARTSSFAFKGQNLEIPEIARRLNVAHVLEGSVRKSGSKLRITAQLVEAASGKHLWSETWDREMADVFAIQDEIAGAVVAELKVALLGEAPRVREVDPEAYSLFLQARQLGRQYTPEGYLKSIELAKHAVAIDPGYAPAWRLLGVNYANQAIDGLLPAREAERLNAEAVEKALAADPGYALAYATLGTAAVNFRRDFTTGARHMQHALELDGADLNILANAANLLGSLGRRQEAIAVMEYARGRDPVNTLSHANLASNYLAAGRFDEAIAAMRLALDLSPGYIGGELVIGGALLAKGDLEGALAAVQREPGESNRLYGLAIVQHARGDRGASDAALAELRERFGTAQPTLVAGACALRGEPDAAFEWLERAVAANDAGLASLHGIGDFKTLADDPRWDALLERLGMQPRRLAEIALVVKLPDSGTVE